MSTTPDRPKGAHTTTARHSKWLFWLNALLAVGSLVLGLDDRGWLLLLRLLVVIGWASLCIVYFRSWRILKRFEGQQ